VTRVRHHRSAAVTVAALAAGLLIAALVSACGGGASQSVTLQGRSSQSATVQDRLLSAADLPTGWAAAPVSQQSVQTSAPCLPSLSSKRTGWAYADAGFVEGTSIPNVGEVLASGPGVGNEWRALARALASCRSATLTIGGKKAKATVRPLAFPRVATTSSAYAWSLTVSGIPIGFDLVLFETRSYAGYVSYSDVGEPPTSIVTAFATAAVDKARTGSTRPVPDDVSVASAPIRVAQTRLGAVGYRVIGSGPPLVLIMGYSGTMETWDRRFVDTLAERYRVVIFDNAGISPTAALRGPLTIDSMANQTSALITALRLSRPAVLGWSMGSMIAQALAVLHPGQVSRLVLCASYPGDGRATRPSQAAINALNTGSQQQVTADLFPADQSAAANAYYAALSSYPAAQSAPAATVTAQGHAVDQWWAGSDKAGQRDTTISVPTLIADGTADRLDPLANSRVLASLITGSKLVLYPDAGHAFLFQDQAAFVPVVESFLS
jgi:pimeloyl-ACP methyl ester carboxylesterase